MKLVGDEVRELSLLAFIESISKSRLSMEDIKALERRLPEPPDVVAVDDAAPNRHGMTIGDLVHGVPAGSRDNSIWELACRLRYGGFDEEFAEGCAVQMALNCDPPFDERLALEKVRRAYAKFDPTIGFTHNTAGIVQHFAAMYGDHLRYDTAQGAWYLWNGRHWTFDRRNEAFRLMEHCVAMMLGAADTIANKEVRTAHIAFCKRSQNVGALKAALDHAARHDALALTGDEWDQVRDKLPCANGVINLRTGQLEPGRREDYLTQASPVAFSPNAEAPLFQKTLREIFLDRSEEIAFIQRAFGYSITGSVKEEKFFLLSGEGSNGKSKLLETVAAILGDFARHGADGGARGQDQSWCREPRSGDAPGQALRHLLRDAGASPGSTPATSGSPTVPPSCTSRRRGLRDRRDGEAEAHAVAAVDAVRPGASRCLGDGVP